MTEQRLYCDIVRDWLDHHIAAAVLPPGMGPTGPAVADRLSVRRSPVKRALYLLAQEGRLSRDARQGYVVAGADRGEIEISTLHLLELDPPEGMDASPVRPSWQRVPEGLTVAVMDCIRFGARQVMQTTASFLIRTFGYAQCVAASRPSSNPDSARTRLPEQTDATSAPSPCSLRNQAETSG